MWDDFNILPIVIFVIRLTSCIWYDTCPYLAVMEHLFGAIGVSLSQGALTRAG